MNVAHLLRAQAEVRPETPALIDPHRRRSLTFGGLDRASAQTAGIFREAGLSPGDSVLVLQPLSVELYIALGAIFRLGLVALFLDPAAGREHMEHCCALWPPKALIASSRAHLLCLLSSSLRRIPVRFHIGAPVPGSRPFLSAARRPPREGIESVDADFPALLTFTSGSTGAPRAALRTHGFLLAQHRAVQECLRLAPGGRGDLATLPIFVLANLGAGVTTVLPDVDLRAPDSADAARLLKQIQAQRPDRITGTPALLDGLADCAAATGRALPELADVFVGGGPVFPSLWEKLARLAPCARITAVYGSTEVEPIAHVTWDEETAPLLRNGGQGLLVGQPVPALELRILRDKWGQPLGPFAEGAFDTECLPPGAAGEIVVRGSHVLPGYLYGCGDEETKIHVADTTVWHRTGDTGYRDATGRLWLLGRCEGRIADARGSLYPLPVECAARAFPGVRRAALIAKGGRRIVVAEPQPPDRAILNPARLRAALS